MIEEEEMVDQNKRAFRSKRSVVERGFCSPDIQQCSTQRPLDDEEINDTQGYAQVSGVS